MPQVTFQMGAGDSIQKLVMHDSGERCFPQVTCNVATRLPFTFRELG